MGGLSEHIKSRAAVTPRLTAVRFGGTALAYTDLDESIRSYENVLSPHGVSGESALVAAVMHRVPGIGAASAPSEQLRMVNEVLAWLGRDFGGGSVRKLHAVG